MAGKPLTTTLNIGPQNSRKRRWRRPSQPVLWSPSVPRQGRLWRLRTALATRSVSRHGRSGRSGIHQGCLRVGAAAGGPDSRSSIKCLPTVTVNGRKFSNYSDYPRNHMGTITFRTALAQSCNTAFIGQRGKLDQSSLSEAAGSLGFGIDYDVGFSSYFGSVPERSRTNRPRRRHDRPRKGPGLADDDGRCGRIGGGRRNRDPAPRRWPAGHFEGKAD